MATDPPEFHSLAEKRSWALHLEVARRLADRPELRERALERVRDWLDDPARHPYARDWQQLLVGELSELQAALASRICRRRSNSDSSKGPCA